MARPPPMGPRSQSGWRYSNAVMLENLAATTPADYFTRLRLMDLGRFSRSLRGPEIQPGFGSHGARAILES